MKNLPKSLFILALISMTVSTASAIDNFFVYEVDEIEEAINTNLAPEGGSRGGTKSGLMREATWSLTNQKLLTRKWSWGWFRDSI